MKNGSLAWRNGLMRRALFQLHLWLGVALGLYVCVISLTGALLMFRIDLQRAVHPELLAPADATVRVGPVTVAESLQKEYPEGRIAGVDSPTTARPVYLAYVTQADQFLTVLVHPGTGRVLGELPHDSPIHTLQELHFHLLGGTTGERINGIGAICLLLLALSGIAIWWEGGGRWRRGFTFTWTGNERRRIWELHRALGIWSVIIIALWAITALSFTFPNAFRAAVDSLSTVTEKKAPDSDASAYDETPTPLALPELIARAERQVPGQHIARVVLPYFPTDSVHVLFHEKQPTPAGTSDFTTIYIDQFSGAVLNAPPTPESIGDQIMKWAGPLHVGNFGGWAIKILWCLAGLAPSVLFVTGFITWWRRVLRPYKERLTRVNRGIRTPAH